MRRGFRFPGFALGLRHTFKRDQEYLLEVIVSVWAQGFFTLLTTRRSTRFESSVKQQLVMCVQRLPTLHLQPGPKLEAPRISAFEGGAPGELMDERFGVGGVCNPFFCVQLARFVAQKLSASSRNPHIVIACSTTNTTALLLVRFLGRVGLKCKSSTSKATSP